MTEIRMTEEIAAQVRGLLPIAMDTRKEFIPQVFADCGLPEEFRPVFTLRPMTKAEKLNFARADAREYLAGDETVFACITEVKNLWNPTTMEPFTDWTRDIFDALHPAVTAEIGSALIDLSCLSPVERLSLK